MSDKSKKQSSPKQKQIDGAAKGRKASADARRLRAIGKHAGAKMGMDC